MSFNLNEEVIDGHLVTAETKKLWAVEMDLAKKLLEVCEKHNIKIWADGGTLLGAVRHKGFIPWDDDMDFVMMRDDYRKLMEIGPQEFQEPYFFQSFYNDEHSWVGLVKIRRSDTAMIEDKYQYHKEFNRGIFIDILALDAIPSDISKYINVYKKIIKISHLLQNYRMINPQPYPFCVRIRHLLIYMYVKLRGSKKMYQKMVELLSMNKFKDNNYCALIEISALARRELVNIKRRNKHCYEETIMLPFQDMQIPVPKGYHELLTVMYGDYMTPVKGWSLHDVLYFDCERSYKEVVKDLNDKRLII